MFFICCLSDVTLEKLTYKNNDKVWKDVFEGFLSLMFEVCVSVSVCVFSVVT